MTLTRRPVEGTLTRLRKGDVILLEGGEYRIDMVNDCRARAVPVAKRTRTVTPQTGPNAGKTITFTETREAINISPNSECLIVGRK